MAFLLSRYGAAVILLVVGMFSWQAFKIHYRNEGKQIVVEASKIEGQKANAKAKKRIDAVKPSDASKRLFSDYHR